MSDSRDKAVNDQVIKEHAKDATYWVDKFFWFIVRLPWFENKIIWTGNSPYLLRVYIYRGKNFPHLFLHYFFRGDKDREVHSHPWKKSISLILTKGYKEERLAFSIYGQPMVIERFVKPFSFNVIRQNDFHKVTLTKGSCWTLFCPGERTVDPKEESWGFLDPKTLEYTYWKTYIEERENETNVG